MNVLNVLYTFNSGGVERLAIDVSNEMAKQGHGVHLCIISEDYDQCLIQQISKDVNLHLLKKEKKYRKFNYLLQIIKIIDCCKIDVIHFHQGTLASFYFLLKCSRPKVRFYITIHDTYTFTQLMRKNQYLCRAICRKIIAISDAVAEDIAMNAVPKDKIRRVYNGVNFTRFPLVERGRPSDTMRIVNVARFYPPKKGQDILIKAGTILRSKGYKIELIFAGGTLQGHDNEIEKMKALANELNITSSVKFLGNVTDVLGVLREGDIFCIPSRYEGFGISAVEAMGTGMPCVASNITGLNEVVNDRAFGELFESENEVDLADKLMYMIDHIDSYRADEISSAIKLRFSIENMVESLIRVFQE